MASVGEDSYGSLPPAQRAALEQEKRRLLEHSEPKDDTQNTDEQQAPTAPGPDCGNAPDARLLTLPDSLETYRAHPRPSPSKRPRLSSSNSAPAAEMEPMVQSTQSPRGSKGVAKAASFAIGAGHFLQGGDTQPVDSQVYHKYTEMESMREDDTPQKQQSVAGTSPETMATDGSETPQQRTLQPGQAGYVDLDGAWQDRETSPTTSFANYDELLAGDNAKSPDTQFFQPLRPVMPETPALAGHKHGRDGEPLTSITTGPKYSQFFPPGTVMGATQLFAQTQEPSSPFANGPHSDDAMTRPSPNTNGAETNDVSSPRTILSSPVIPRHVRSSSGAGEPRSEYTSMKESQERRERRKAQLQQGTAPEDVESDSDDDTQHRRFRAKQLRRSMSEQALKEAARVSAPRRGVHPLSSARKSIVNLVTPATVRRKVSFDDILEEADEDETQVELPENVSNGEVNEDDEHATGSHDEDDDQYDELQEKVIRSQTNFQVDEDDEASVVGSMQESGIELANNEEPLEDTQEPSDVDAAIEDDELQDPRDGEHDTQRSTIADSQPLAHATVDQHNATPRMHHSSMASFVPGSQYTGKTSQDQAFLKASHPSQIRVAASQANEAEKMPSSPPLARAIFNSPTSADQASIHRELPESRQSSALDNSATPREVPDSDVAERVVEEHQLEPQAAGSGEEESHQTVPFSTAQTHVSASTRSPTKSFVAPSPLKAFRSQQNETPRKAFSDMIDGPKAAHASFDFVDVDDIMADVMTKEDEEVLAVLSSPRTKRRKTTHSSPASSRLESGHAESDRYTHWRSETLRHTTSDTSRTIQDSEPDFARPAIPAKVHEASHAMNERSTVSVNTSEMEGTIPESEPNSAPLGAKETVLRDSPSKANVLPIAPARESPKARSLTPDSAARREGAGFRHVSQLISTTRHSAPAPKKGKLKTPGNLARRRSDKEGTKASKSTERVKPSHGDSVEDPEGELLDTTEAIEEAEVVDDINLHDTTPPPSERVHQAVVEPPTSSNVEDMPDAAAVGKRDSNDTCSALNRVWAFFRGTPPNYYPATWMGGSQDGLSGKIRFDDNTITTTDTWLVRRLELRIGDLVKVDNGIGSRSKTWRVVGFGAVAEEGKDSELGTDIHGHTRIKVQATSNRNSISKGGAAVEDAEEVCEVLVSDLYLTSGMWKNYKDREFSPPTTTKTMASRSGTPSSRLQTPDGDTPSSRSRRHGPLTSKSKKNVGSSHLREASVSTTMSTGSTMIFTGMAFAVTYISDNAEKAQVTRMIQRNGGIILEDGFGELFDVPTIGEPITSPSKKSPRKNLGEETHQLGLRLKPKYEDYGFVALIADRHSRRAKYMQALALDLPTLSGRWILDSLNEVKNASLKNAEAAPLPWGKYLLPAGESSYLGGAIRSRIMLPYDANSRRLQATIDSRPTLLRNEGVLIVAPKKDKVAWERRKTYAFLTLALGAGKVERVNDLQDAKNMMETDQNVWKWIYVDGKLEEALSKVSGRVAGGKKRKRESETDGGPKMSVTDGFVTVVNDEFVVQSLILGALAD